MNTKRWFRRPQVRALLLVAAAWMLLAACDLGGGAESATQAIPAPTATPTPLPTPTPTPAEISARIGRATQGSSTAHFAITLSGKPVFADAEQLFVITAIEGDLRRPDGLLAILKISGAGGVAEIRSVSLAGRQYVTNPVTRQWSCLAPGGAFDPLILFDAAKGIEYLLQQGFKNVTLAGIEDVGGRQSYHLRGTIDGPLLQAISDGRIGAGPVDVELWADVETMRASRIVLIDAATDQANPSTWTITFTDYDKPVDVRVPPGAQC